VRRPSADCDGGQRTGAAVEIAQVQWRGLRCRVLLSGLHQASPSICGPSGRSGLDLVGGAKAPNASGQTSLAVADDQLEGTWRWSSVLDSADRALAQQRRTIGGEE